MTLVNIFSIWRSCSNLQVIHFDEICHVMLHLNRNYAYKQEQSDVWAEMNIIEVNRGLHPLLIRRNVALLQWVIGKERKCYLFQIIVHLLNLVNPSPWRIIFISQVSSAYFSEEFLPSSPSLDGIHSFSMNVDQPVQFSAIIFQIRMGSNKQKPEPEKQLSNVTLTTNGNSACWDISQLWIGSSLLSDFFVWFCG